VGVVSIRSKSLTSKQLANKIAQLASTKKAQDILILDMRGLVNFCDFFVLSTGTSDRQVKAIAEGIEDGLSDLGIKSHIGRNVKGLGSSEAAEGLGAWVLLDLGDVVAHVFEPNSREFYGLEHLWQDAPTVAYKERKKKTKLS
jgi:ribosome-associated protein